MSYVSSALNKISQATALFEQFQITRRQLTLYTFLVLGFAALEGVGVGLLYLVLSFLEGGRETLLANSPQLVTMAINGMENIGIPLEMTTLALLIVTMLAVRQILGYAKNVLSASLVCRTRAYLQRKAAKKFLKADVPYYFTHNRSEMVFIFHSLTSDSALIVQSFLSMFAALLLLCSYLLILVFISQKMFLLLLPPILMMLLFYRRTTHRGRTLARQLQDAANRTIEQINEIYTGIRLIKLRHAEAQLGKWVNETVDTVADRQVDIRKATALSEATALPMIIVLSFLVLYFAHEMIGISISSLGVYAFLILRMAPQLTAISQGWVNLGTGIAGYTNLKDRLETVDSFTHPQDGDTPFTGIKDGLRFEDVYFRYHDGDNEVLALNGLDLEIRGGQTVALVGPSGAGKSTTIDLLPRFIEPHSGAITIDGTPLPNFELDSLRERIAMVSQEPVMFDDTLRYNITFGVDAEASDARLQSVLEQSYCLEFIRDLPEGLETRIGESGVRLSGGQRQRIALARALYAEPDILVLDEPTSALDSMSEVAIQQTLENLHGKITIILIAHRLSTVRKADNIYVLEKGRVVMSGRHEQLVNADGIYQQFFNLQVGQGGE